MIISKFIVFDSKDLLNFTYTVSKPLEGTFGRLSKDGTWDGMVRLLQDGDVDIGLLCVFFECEQALLVVLEGERIWNIVSEATTGSFFAIKS